MKTYTESKFYLITIHQKLLPPLFSPILFRIESASEAGMLSYRSPALGSLLDEAKDTIACLPVISPKLHFVNDPGTWVSISRIKYSKRHAFMVVYEPVWKLKIPCRELKKTYCSTCISLGPHCVPWIPGKQPLMAQKHWVCLFLFHLGRSYSWVSLRRFLPREDWNQLGFAEPNCRYPWFSHLVPSLLLQKLFSH